MEKLKITRTATATVTQRDGVRSKVAIPTIVMHNIGVFTVVNGVRWIRQKCRRQGRSSHYGKYLRRNMVMKGNHDPLPEMNKDDSGGWDLSGGTKAAWTGHITGITYSWVGDWRCSTMGWVNRVARYGIGVIEDTSGVKKTYHGSPTRHRA